MTTEKTVLKEDTKDQENLFEREYEKLYSILSHFVMGELETTIPFEEITDKEREIALKSCMKAIEVSSSVMSYFFELDGFKIEKLGKVAQLLEEKKFKEASVLVFKDEAE